MKYSIEHEEKVISKVGPLVQQHKTIQEICDILNKEGPWPKISEYWNPSSLVNWLKHGNRNKQIDQRFPITMGDEHAALTDWLMGDLKRWEKIARSWFYIMSKSIKAGTTKVSEKDPFIENIEEVLTRPKMNKSDKVAAILGLFADGNTFD